MCGTTSSHYHPASDTLFEAVYRVGCNYISVIECVPTKRALLMVAKKITAVSKVSQQLQPLFLTLACSWLIIAETGQLRLSRV
jgi:hypothetical protein